MNATLNQVKRLTSGWRHVPPIDVVPSSAALPVKAPEDVQGLYFRGRVWLVDHPELDAPAVLAHETLGHHAPRMLLGRHWTGTMRALSLGLHGGDPELAPLRERVQAVYRDPDGEYALTRIGEADEVVARLAELRVHPQTGALQVDDSGRKRLQAAMGHFRRQVLFLDEPLSKQELEGLLDIGWELIREGFPWWHWASWCYPAAVPKPSTPAARPLHRYKPPMSLRQSERLLDRSGDLGEGLKTLALLVGMIVLPIVFFGSLAYWAFHVFGALSRLLF